MMLLTLPIIFPTILSMGYDPIWFGIIMVVLVEIAAITPPFAINVFVMKSALPDVPTGTIIRAIMPFILAYIPMLAILIAFPQIALFLPNRM